MTRPPVDQRVVDAVAFQRDAGVTSPLYMHVLGAVLADISDGGPCAAVLSRADPRLDPIAHAIPLRFLGGVHRIVLEGRAPELAAHYPSVGGHFEPEDPDEDTAGAFIATVEASQEELVAALGRSVQTNEVARSAALLPGYLALSRTTGLPLRVIEIGTSAGLNLRWDLYRYEGGAGGSAWGDPTSAVRFADRYVEPLPDLDVPASVVERRGCDANPLDPSTPDDRLTLRSFVWPDQVERLGHLDAALRLAAAVPVPLDRTATPQTWIDELLSVPVDGVATVVVHSIVWQYLPGEARRHIRRSLESAGTAASRTAPLAWLRMEPGADPTKSAEVRLTSWPGGSDELLARAGYHGHPVRMHASTVAG